MRARGLNSFYSAKKSVKPRSALWPVAIAIRTQASIGSCLRQLDEEVRRDFEKYRYEKSAESNVESQEIHPETTHSEAFALPNLQIHFVFEVKPVNCKRDRCIFSDFINLYENIGMVIKQACALAVAKTLVW